MQIYDNLKILDLTRILSGPLATRHFADLDANVIKIEPIHGDDTRNFPPIVDNWSGYFEILNRNKKS
jgi:crotonobetainyl-CoA:carnitine CoA-transferase CaiB-like acyl-CoA transferase